MAGGRTIAERYCLRGTGFLWGKLICCPWAVPGFKNLLAIIYDVGSQQAYSKVLGL